MIIDFLCIIAGYLLGSISTAVLVCRAAGLPDPRTQGSHNPGATNVLRFGGRKAAAMTLVGDCVKGILPVLLAFLLGAGEYGIAGAALGAFFGHLYPLYFGFHGGKGVATAFGAILALSFQVALAMLVVWLALAFTLRISSISALSAAVLAPLFAWWFGLPVSYILAIAVMAAMLIWRHRDNIRRLLQGAEKQIGSGG